MQGSLFYLIDPELNKIIIETSLIKEVFLICGMNKEEIISKTIIFVKSELENAEGGHDWFHIERVWKLSKEIAESEKADLFVVELGALLHDIADAKFYNGNEEIGPRKARAFLEKHKLEENIIIQVENIIRNISFKNSLERNEKSEFLYSKELKVVQDADRLDAIGAIGIARAFNYGGFKNRALYDPAVKIDLHQDKETYKKSQAPTINHFYEKLLVIKDKMNTNMGRRLAIDRHDFMMQYLDQFYAEWNANK